MLYKCTDYLFSLVLHTLVLLQILDHMMPKQIVLNDIMEMVLQATHCLAFLEYEWKVNLDLFSLIFKITYLYELSLRNPMWHRWQYCLKSSSPSSRITKRYIIQIYRKRERTKNRRIIEQGKRWKDIKLLRTIYKQILRNRERNINKNKDMY